jgi:hypothetical protein
MHLALESCPKTLHTHFNNLLKHFYILEMPHIYALAFANMAEIACKTGHFVSAKKSMLDVPNG